MHDEKNGNKIVDLNQARKTLKDNPRRGASTAKQKANGGGDGYGRALKGQKGPYKGPGQINLRWYHYVQTIGMLLLVAWMMQTCQR